MSDESRRTFSLTIHPWCMSPSRDEAVRAAEDGREGPLPTLDEAISRAGQFVPSEAPQGPKCTERESGLRTELVTLEVTHRFADPIASVLLGALNSILSGHGESVFVMDGSCEITALTAERDAAIREREDAKQHHARECAKCSALADKVIGLKARVAELERAWTAECDALAQAHRELSDLAEAVNKRESGEECDHSYAAQCREAAAARDRADRMMPAPAANADAVSNPQPISGLGKSAVDETQEPDAWGVRRKGGVDAVAHRLFRSSAERSAEQFGGTVVPLYAAPVAESATTPQPSPGWLTAEQREAVAFAAQKLYELSNRQYVNGDQDAARDTTREEDFLRSILARSSPPEVVLPRVYCHGGDGEPLVDLEDVRAALAAAGVTVKEVGSE